MHKHGHIVEDGSTLLSYVSMHHKYYDEVFLVGVY
jgi:hypothetical protein